MRKTLIIALREYRAAVKTKGFIIGLVLAPILMGGGMVAFLLMKDRVDTSDKNIAIVDRSGLVGSAVKEAAEYRNEHEISDPETGNQIRPAYHIEIVQPDTVNPADQILHLSERVRTKEIHAFVVVEKDILHPENPVQQAQIQYYSENSFMDEIRYWFSNPINNALRDIRVRELNLDPNTIADLFWWFNVEGMGLASVDKKTGDLREASKTNELQGFLVPYVMMLLMFLLVMMSAAPLLSAVMEEKMERIAEVLLGSVTPFQFMAGKIIGSISISLTSAAVYVIGGVFMAREMGVGNLIPYEVLPWFFMYMILFIIMIGSLMAALGSTCNDSKDAQALQFPAMIPVLIPLFIMVPVLQDPGSTFSTVASLIPPFTPALMLIRQASSVTIPAWEPVAGLAGIILFTAFSVWVGGRIFRTAILMQGQKPTLSNIFRYALKG